MREGKELEVITNKNKRSFFNRALQEIAKTLIKAFVSAVASLSVLTLALYYVSPIVENVLTFGLVDVLDRFVAASAIFLMMYALFTVRKIMEWYWKR